MTKKKKELGVEEGAVKEEIEAAEEIEVEEADEAETSETESAEQGSKAGEGEEEAPKERKRKEKKAVKKRKSKKEKENPIARAVRLAVETGKVDFGAKTGIKDSLLAKAKLIVVASNAPRELQEDIQHYSKLSGIHVLTFDGTSMELGFICGKPYPVSVLSVYDAGSSNILDLAKK